ESAVPDFDEGRSLAGGEVPQAGGDGSLFCPPRTVPETLVAAEQHRKLASQSVVYPFHGLVGTMGKDGLLSLPPSCHVPKDQRPGAVQNGQALTVGRECSVGLAGGRSKSIPGPFGRIGG